MEKEKVLRTTDEEIPDNGHNEIDWDSFKEQYAVPTIPNINGRLQVYRQALKAYFKTGDEACLDVVNHNLLENPKHRPVADKVLLGVRKEIKS